MTPTQTLALFFYGLGGVLAIAGPAIAATRLVMKYRVAKEYEGTWDDFDKSFDAHTVHGDALRDATWGVVEFSFVALGVVFASIASIILVVAA